MAALTPVPKIQFFDANGHPLAGGKLYSYSAGTTTPLVTYTDQAGTSANTNPVILDARGEASVWLGTGPYKLRLTTATDVDIWTVDDIYSEGALSMQELLSSAGSSLVGFIQSGTGATYRTVQSKLRDTVSVKDFGAVGDGVADDTAAIQAAANYAETSGALLQGVPGTFKITSTLQLNCSGDLSAMAIVVDATAVNPAIRIGPTTGYLFNAELSLPKVTNSAKTSTGWTGFETSVGVEMANVYQSRITVKEIRNFGIGLSCGGYTAGFVYNTVTIGILANNKINLRLKPQLTTGWSNQNLFIGGRYFHDSAEGVAISNCYHIQTIEADGAVTDTSPNNNLFLNPSIEGSETQYQIYLMGAYNQFANARFEPVGKVLLIGTLSNMTRGNVILGGYDSGAITYTVSGGVNVGPNQVIGQVANNTLHFSENGVNVANRTSSGLSAPHFQGFEATQNPITKTAASTDWIYRIHGAGISVKGAASAYPRVEMSSGGVLYLGSGVISPNVYFSGGNGYISCTGLLYPGADNTYDVGSGSLRWRTIYATTGTINTSDEREKQDIAALDAAEKRVAVALKGLVKKFRFKDAVQAKGDDARIHVGVIAQEVIAAFQAENLDPMRYGIVCYDQWDAEDERPAGNRYGVRYEELLAFIIASL